MRRKAITVLSLLLIVTLISCGKSEDEKTKPLPTAISREKAGTDTGIQQSSEIEQVKTSEKEQSDFVFPTAGARPIAVMIDNEGPRFTTQGGLDKAQLVYEVIAEAGETRLMAVFWGVDAKLIGPVRSSRHYFLDYALEHDALYFHIGFSPFAEADMKKYNIDHVDGRIYAYYWDIDKNRGNWQDSFTSMEKLKEYIEKLKFRTSTDKKLVFSYNNTDKFAETGEKAEKIDLRYSSQYSCGFEYDSQTGLYNRFRRGKPQMERSTEKQLTAKNILIENVECFGVIGDDAGRQQVKDVGSGTGWYISGGKAVEISWSKASRFAQSQYRDKNGNEIILNPGQTWIQIVPTSGKVTIQ